VNVWIAAVYEPVPALDGRVRRLRWGLLAHSLAERGHVVTLWTPGFDHVRKRQRVHLPTAVAYDEGITAQLLPAPGYRSNISLRRVRHNRVFADGFSSAVAAAGEVPDIIVASVPTLELADAAVRSGRDAGVPVVVDVMDRWPDVYLTALPRSTWGFARRLLASEYRRAARIFRDADAVAAVSRTYLRWACELGGRSQTGEVFPLSYEAPAPAALAEARRLAQGLREQWGVRPGERVAVFIGSFGRSSQVLLVADAARRLAAEGRSDVRILIAGGGAQEDRLRAATADLANVSLTGWLDHTASLALLDIADIGLAPYDARAQQSLPYKPFEYMAHGLPVVTSLDGELREVLESQGIGYYFPAGNATALAQRLRDCVDRPAELERMGERAREVFERDYAAERVYPAFAAFIEGVAARRARGVAC
jgi:glycosyltransferase involved in cell wall biosynthesis